MTHKIQSVKPLANFILLVTFRNGTEKTYDVKPLFAVFPQFTDLQTIPALFEQVKVDVGGYGIFWNDDFDLDAEELWDNGSETGIIHEQNLNQKLAESLISARNHMKLTQKQLASYTGINQGDISKIENGTANPSLSTLKRLAKGLNMRLEIAFIPNENPNRNEDINI